MGLPLDTAKKWLAARRGDIEPADQAFIEASVRAERAVARNRQRLQAAVGVLMLGTIAGLLGIIFKDEISDLLVRAHHPAPLHRSEFHAICAHVRGRAGA